MIRKKVYLPVPRTLLYFLLSFFVFSCAERSGEKPVMLAFSKGSPVSSYYNYYRWVSEADSAIVIKDMYSVPDDSLLVVFNDCSGLLLTGGTDVYPGLYGMEKDTSRCWKPDHRLDSIEMILIREAVRRKIPILGICRGEQMLNVAFGGTLVIDLPEDRPSDVRHQCDDYLHCYHPVKVVDGSMLSVISGVREDSVTSNHHQGIDKLAQDLEAAAYARDGLVEAVEWKDPQNKPFLLAVQWHPERMSPENQLSTPILNRFLAEMKLYHDNSK